MENERNFEVCRFKIHDIANLSTKVDLQPIADLPRPNIHLPTNRRSGRNVVEEESATDHWENNAPVLCTTLFAI